MLAIEKNHEHGIYWYDADENISLFEDLEHGCYAWRGTWEDHDRAKHTSVHATAERALEDLHWMHKPVSCTADWEY